MVQNTLHLLGYASGLAGAAESSGSGPLIIKQSHYFTMPFVHWQTIIPSLDTESLRADEKIRNMCQELAKKTAELVRQKQFFVVIGGDHTSAIGTWSGVYDALHERGEMGLIWIDAHMDSHTPETTESGRLHGMPLASLMGYGYPTLTSILHHAPKLKPENVCLIGVRSYEEGEARLLERLSVRVYFMDEVKKRGFATVLKEAVKKVSQHTVGYGISLDLDSIDPKDAPGVGVPEPDGIPANNLHAGLSQVVFDPKLIAAEIVEFDPMRDKNHMTEKLIIELLKVMQNQNDHTRS